jgi:O-methyltransferase involved in polyketide biosynthesis
MVCACRALETARADGFVHDPFAERLAGPRGTAIAQVLPEFERMCFGIAVRSYFIDGLIRDLIAERAVSTVLCLGAGLDTRPWRLDLPAALRLCCGPSNTCAPKAASTVQRSSN